MRMVGEWHIDSVEGGGYRVSYRSGTEAMLLGQTPPEFTQMRDILNWVWAMKLTDDTVYVDGKLQLEPPNN